MDRQDRKGPPAAGLLTALSLGLLAGALLTGGPGRAEAGQDIATLDAAAARQAQADRAARMLAAKTGAMAKVGTALAGLPMGEAPDALQGE